MFCEIISARIDIQLQYFVPHLSNFDIKNPQTIDSENETASQFLCEKMQILYECNIIHHHLHQVMLVLRKLFNKSYRNCDNIALNISPTYMR